MEKYVSGLSRLYQHMTESDFAIISADLDKFSKKENDEKERDMGHVIQMEYGYGYIEIDSYFTYSDTGERVAERSFFIPSMTYDDAKAIASDFGQGSFIWGGDLQGHVGLFLVSGDGRMLQEFPHTAWGMNAAWEDYSSHRGKSFHYSSPDEVILALPESTFEGRGRKMIWFHTATKGRSWTFDGGLIDPSLPLEKKIELNRKCGLS